MSLTAPERETIVNMSDADDTALITTYQRPVISRLRRNPAAVLLSEGTHDGTAWAEFRLPARLVNFRAPYRMSAEDRAAVGARGFKRADSRSDSGNNSRESEAIPPGPTSGVGGGI